MGRFSPLNLCNWLALTGLVGLIILIVLWNGWFTPVQSWPRSVEILILCLPQLALIYGVLYRRYYPHVYMTFPALFYFLMGFWYATSDQEQLYGYGLMLLGLMQFIGGFCFARIIMIRDKNTKTNQNK